MSRGVRIGTTEQQRSVSMPDWLISLENGWKGA